MYIKIETHLQIGENANPNVSTPPIAELTTVALE